MSHTCPPLNEIDCSQNEIKIPERILFKGEILLYNAASKSCSPFLCRLRETLAANQPDAQEVLGLFRAVLLEEVDRVREEEESRRLTRQWNNKHSVSMSLVNFRSRIKINPFGSTAGLTSASMEAGASDSDLKTVSRDVERGVATGGERAQRGWSLPDY